MLAKEVAEEVCQAAQNFPDQERYGLQARILWAATAVAASLTEGCSRTSTKDFLHFVDLSLTSTAEVRSLIESAHRSRIIGDHEYRHLDGRLREMARELSELARGLRS
jgi:four helix bundle protein